MKTPETAKQNGNYGHTETNCKRKLVRVAEEALKPTVSCTN
jgi:hypothetical protein